MSIKKITIDIDGKEIEMTLEQAKALHRELGQLFDSPTPIYPYYPYPYNPITPGTITWNDSIVKVGDIPYSGLPTYHYTIPCDATDTADIQVEVKI